MFNIKQILKYHNCSGYLKRYHNFAGNYLITFNRSFCEVHSNILLDFEQNENDHFHRYMASNKQYRSCIAFLDCVHQTTLPVDANFVLNSTLSGQSVQDLLEYFKIVLRSIEEIPRKVDDPKFLQFCELIRSRVSDFTDDQLLDLLKILTLWPKDYRKVSSEFFSICKTVDDETVKRMKQYGRDRLLLTMDHFYRLRVVRYSNFVWENLKRVCRNPDNLPSHLMVHSIFLLNALRNKHPVGTNMLQVEYALEQKLYDLSVEELAIVALGFFKCGAKLTNFRLIESIYMKLETSIDFLDSMTLAACLKILRTSTPYQLRHRVMALYDKLMDHLDNFTLTCCIHIALLGTQHVLVFHPALLQKISERLLKEISSARLKEIERFIFTLTLFNFTPNTIPNIFTKAIEELRLRDKEIIEYPRPFFFVNSYLAIMGIYDYDFVDRILSTEFLESAFKEIIKYTIPPSVLQMACGVRLDCPDYNGCNLEPAVIQEIGEYLCWNCLKVAKKGIRKTDRFLLQLNIILRQELGGDDFVHLVHSLPYSVRPDLIFCMKDGKPVKIPKSIKAKETCLETVRPPDIGEWCAILTQTTGNTIADSEEPVGGVQMKIRHLKILGYRTLLIKENIWTNLEIDKSEYLRKTIQNSQQS